MTKRTLTSREGLERVARLPHLKGHLESDNADEVAGARKAVATIRALVLPEELQRFDGELDAWLER